MPHVTEGVLGTMSGSFSSIPASFIVLFNNAFTTSVRVPSPPTAITLYHTTKKNTEKKLSVI